MPKVLTATPSEGETPEAFATRVATQIEDFFGGDSTDVSAESTSEPEQEPQPE